MKLSPSKVIGAFLAVVHFALFMLFSITTNIGSKDAMSGMLWGLWKTVDFPISLLAFYGFVPMPLEWNIATFWKFVYPYLVHGIIGTIWWFFIPVLIGGISTRLFSTAKSDK